MGLDLGVEKDGPPISPFPSFFLKPLPQHRYHAQRGSGAIEQGKYVPTSKGREQWNRRRGQSPTRSAPDPCPGGKLKIYFPWEKANDPPHPHSIPLEAGAGASQLSPVTAIVCPRYSASDSTSDSGCLPLPQAAVCNLKMGFQSLPPCQLDFPAGSQNPNAGSEEKARSPRIPISRGPPRLTALSRHPCFMQAWALEKGFRRSWTVGCTPLIPDPLPGRGLARPRPSSWTPNPAFPFPKSFPFQDQALRGQAPAITAPQRCRGSRPARAGLVAGTGGVPSRAPPRGAGPFKGKVDPRLSVGPIWGTRDALRMCSRICLRTRRGAVREGGAWGHEHHVRLRHTLGRPPPRSRAGDRALTLAG